MINKTISHYKILEKLGQGGMGVVYKARDTKLDRIVALKFLPQNVMTNETDKARFLQEAKAAAAINHANVCTIFDIQEHEGQQFIVMEYVEGTTLKEEIKKGELKSEKILDYAGQIAEALKAAHDKEIIHRDIKSENIMVTTTGQVKVMDFGLARFRGSEHLTKTTSTVGTIAYSSPEQLQGHEVDARSDIFSFGVVLYELLTGQLPFKGEYESAMMYSILNEEPEPIQKIIPDLSSECLHILNRALEKEKNDRYQTISDVLIDLRRLKKSTEKPRVVPAPGGKQFTKPNAIPERGKKTKKKIIWFGIPALFSVAILFLLIFNWSGEAPVSTLKNTVPISPPTDAIGYPTWSNDGTRVAYHSYESRNFDIWITEPDLMGTKRNLTKDYEGADLYPSWSPDGKLIAFWSSRENGGYFTVSPLGGRVNKVALLNRRAPARPGSPQWSPDGSKLAFVNSDSIGYKIEIVSLKGEKQTIRLPNITLTIPGWDLSWSPDGRFFAYATMWNWTSALSPLYIVRVEDGEIFQVTDGHNMDTCPRFSQDGGTLYFVSNRGGSHDLWQMQLNKNGAPKNKPQPITFGTEMREFQFSRDERQLVYSKGKEHENIWRVPVLQDRLATWEDAQQLTHTPGQLKYIRLSPDHKTLAFNKRPKGKMYIYTIPVQGGEMKKLTKDTINEYHPEWSPDGQEIVFHSEEFQNLNIYVAFVKDGTNRQLTNNIFSNLLARWSPDGMYISYYSIRDGSQCTWIVNTKTGLEKQLTFEGAEYPIGWSEDGESIYFRKFQVYIEQYRPMRDEDRFKVNVKDGKIEQTSEEPKWRHLQVSPDGKYWYGIGKDKGRYNIWQIETATIETATRKERRITDFTGKKQFWPYVGAVDDEYVYFVWQSYPYELWVSDVEFGR